MKKATAHKKGSDLVYHEGIGRRKTAVARARIRKGKGVITINDRPLQEYFGLSKARKKAASPLVSLGVEEELDVTVKIRGGGPSAQAEAVRHGVARALALSRPEFAKKLRALGYLTRDPRMVERKKYGLRKARRAPQWSKR